jgi:tripartite-type tricarboxylate transporter receptor subunit TctC
MPTTTSFSRRALLALGFASAVGGLLGPQDAARSQPAYPTKPVRLIVPFPPGGGTDILARVIGNKLSEVLGKPIVVENKPGAGGNIGVDLVAKAPPDGYTMVIGQTSNLAVNPTLYTDLPYDPQKDLAPITLVADAPLVMVVAANSPFKTIGDVIAAAKAKPEDVTFASPGSGTVAHLSGELLQKAANVKFQHIPYKGAAQALTDLMGGQVQTYMSSIPTALSQIKGGKLRALAVTSTKRVPELPDVPTVAESGFSGFESSTWFGLLVKAGTPEPIIKRLNTEVLRVLQTPDVREKIAAEGATVLGGTPDQFSAFLKDEIVKWGKVVKESGAKVE